MDVRFPGLQTTETAWLLSARQQHTALMFRGDKIFEQFAIVFIFFLNMPVFVLILRQNRLEIVKDDQVSARAQILNKLLHKPIRVSWQLRVLIGKDIADATHQYLFERRRVLQGEPRSASKQTLLLMEYLGSERGLANPSQAIHQDERRAIVDDPCLQVRDFVVPSTEEFDARSIK